MTDDSPEGEPATAGLGDERRELLQHVALALALVVAAIHLAHPDRGLPRLVTVLTADPGLLIQDPRPLALVLSGIVIVLGVNAAIVEVRLRPLYAMGMALMALHLVGYFAWHLTGHGGFLPGREPHYHGLDVLVAELLDDVLILTSKLTEAALLIVLGILYRDERDTT